MQLTPEQIKAVGDTLVNVIAAFGAIVASIATAVTGYFTFKNRRDLHIAHDRIREIRGEPLQHRQDPEQRPAPVSEQPKSLPPVDDI